MLASCAIDKTVTIWDTYDSTEKASGVAPKPCSNKDMNVGKLYTLGFYQSNPWLLGTAGAGKELALWDMTRESNIQNRFGDRLASQGKLITSAAQAPEVADEMSEAAAFNPTMSGENTSTIKVELGSKSKATKNKGKKKKKKAHRAGRNR